MSGLLILFALLLKIPGLFGLKCSISQVTINVTASAAICTWSIGPECISFVDHYYVEVHHLAWSACLSHSFDSAEETGWRGFNVSYSRLDISRLYPYSQYYLEIRAINTKQETIATHKEEFGTQVDVPDTKPVLRIQNGSETAAEAYSSAIKFYWADPDQCSQQNGRKDGYWIELRGLDPWVIDPQIIKNMSVSGTEYFAGALLPYTWYMLRVFTRNVGDLVNRNVYLELQEQTKPRQPDPPVNIFSKTISETSVFLSWTPAYPRTGLIERYLVRQGIVEHSGEYNWFKPISVNSHNGSCPDHRAGYICYVVNNLDPGTQYIFKIQTYNKDISKPSVWSEETIAETLKINFTTEEESETTVLPPSSDTYTPRTGDNSTLIIVICLAGALVLLGTIVASLVYKLKLDKLKTRLRLEQTISLGRLDRLDSTYTTDSIHIQGSTYTSTPLSIQCRRLPEPPPYPGQQLQQPAHGNNQYTHSYEVPRPIGYLDMSLGSRKSSNSRYGFEGDENKEEEEGEEEGEDMEGYLKPTFPQIERKSPSFMFPELRSSSIQVESYGTSSPGAPRSQGQISSRPDLIPPDRTSPSSLTSSNSNQPLVISKSVDI